MYHIQPVVGARRQPRHRAGSRRIATFLTIALSVVALGRVTRLQAQDAAQQPLEKQFEAAGTQLKTAVANGEMTEAEAWAAWHATRKTLIREAAAAGSISTDKAAAWVEEINREQLGGQLKEAGDAIKAAAARGELGEDEAWAEWYATKDALIAEAVADGRLTAKSANEFQRDVYKAELRERLGTAGERIKAAAERGEITEERAWVEWYAAKDRLIAEAIAVGEITEADAAEFRRALYQEELKERIDAAGERIKGAVARGEMSEDEGWDAWAVAREELIAQAAADGEISDKTAEEFRHGYERWAVGQRLRIAVARGEMTELDAWAKWAAYSGETEEYAAKLEALVASGALTAEEAKARLRAVNAASGAKADAAPSHARIVLRAIKRVELTKAQRERIREIEQQAIGDYRAIPRGDKAAQRALAGRVKAEILQLLDKSQAARFEEVLGRLDRGAE